MGGRALRRAGGQGFAVVRYDNRDSGLSSQVRGGSRRRPAYTLDDMADDAVAVMDALGWEGAHLFGAAAGGTIAQLVALRRPHRVRTLALAASYAGWRLGRMRPGAILRMLAKGLRRPAPGREGYARGFVEAVRPLTSADHPLDEELWREIALTMFDRCPEPGPGSMRQAAALQAAGDLLPRLGGVTAPTLVIHGEADPMVRLRAARRSPAPSPARAWSCTRAWATTSRAASGRRSRTNCEPWPRVQRPRREARPRDGGCGDARVPLNGAPR
ncbi:alpha/beta fold hydrolase [Nonomuraea rubra]|uniref:alpha/beta fold hydrolase n=1 Tax=Nonomuraea rubra TaxID=46180 RepID=UPI0036139D01